MKLVELKISGLKCYLNSGTIPIHDLTVFIGENDAGKSTIFDALEIVFNNKPPHIDDFREGVENIEIEVKFDIEDIDEEFEFLIHDDAVMIKKIIDRNRISSFHYFAKVFQDQDLYSYESMNAVDLKALLQKYGLSEESNQALRKEAVKNYIETEQSIPRIETWQPIRQNEISNFLPIFQRFSSNDYGNPENTIRKTLELVYRSSFYNKDEDGNETLKSYFSDLKSSITDDLNNKLENQLLSQLQKYKPEINSIMGSYDIDFARGLSFSGLNIVDQSGREKTLSQLGEGSKKKIFLSILEWDAEINSENSSNKLIIRGYDEPDSNLHYEAQRKMFYVIRDLAVDQSTNVQSMICTHSLTMIDRAPSKCINHVIRNPTKEISEIQFLQSESDTNIKDFLNQVSEVSGFKNSSLFYEKCFLIVEGESEQNALPIMYKKIYGRHLSEDGIVLINLQTNGQWNNALRFLNSNKNDCTVMLLDNDTQDPSSLNQVTTAKLNEIGFNSTFLTSNCFFIGTKEFEDVFSNEQLIRTFNSKFIKHSGIDWNDSEIAALRSDKKFSKSLKIKLSQECRKSIGKPLLATELANELTKIEIESIAKIKDLFDKVQTIIE
jgi:putative ATP-dependent endonuclease of the OLD family